MTTPYTYIFIREDLSPVYQIIQSSHAALEAGFKFKAPERTSHIVLCGVKDVVELLERAEFLYQQGIKFQIFYEPDYNTGYTAIATEPICDDLKREPLRIFPLFKTKSCNK